jgi:hypothetical protein
MTWLTPGSAIMILLAPAVHVIYTGCAEYVA